MKGEICHQHPGSVDVFEMFQSVGNRRNTMFSLVRTICQVRLKFFFFVTVLLTLLKLHADVSINVLLFLKCIPDVLVLRFRLLCR